MQDQKAKVRSELYRLLLDEEAGVACNLIPRMLADPESLTPEIRWCIFYLVRGIGCLAGRNGLLGEGTILDTVVEDFETVRLQKERLDWLWFEVIREEDDHWLSRYESTAVRYSLGELLWLNDQLGKLWTVERERLELEEPPLQPLALRDKRRSQTEASRLAEA